MEGLDLGRGRRADLRRGERSNLSRRQRADLGCCQISDRGGRQAGDWPVVSCVRSRASRFAVLSPLSWVAFRPCACVLVKAAI
jgi:hypothetical protein